MLHNKQCLALFRKMAATCILLFRKQGHLLQRFYRASSPLKIAPIKRKIKYRSLSSHVQRIFAHVCVVRVHTCRCRSRWEMCPRQPNTTDKQEKGLAGAFACRKSDKSRSRFRKLRMRGKKRENEEGDARIRVEEMHMSFGWLWADYEVSCFGFNPR